MATLDFAPSTALLCAMAEPVIIENRRFWARVLTLFWVAEVIMGLGFAATGIGWLGGEDIGLAAVMIVCALLLAGVGVMMTALSWRIARLKGAAIEMSEAGFLDRRIAEAVTPWNAIAWKIVFNSRSYSLQFDAAAPHGAALRRHWDLRLMGRFNRFFKYPEFTVVTLGAGFKGGEVTPLFFIGAALGNALAGLLGAPPDLFAALGFVAIFAGATNTPLACTLMGIELFGATHSVYIATACFLAFLFSGRSSIYTSQRVAVP